MKQVDGMFLFALNKGTGATRDLVHDRGIVIPIIDKESCGANLIDLHQVVLTPGEKTQRVHYHDAVENVYVVLSGRGEILTGSGAIPVRAGDVAFIPPGVPHEPRNTGRQKMRIIEIKTPQQKEDDFHVVRTVEPDDKKRRGPTRRKKGSSSPGR